MVPLGNVRSADFSKVMEYCNEHAKAEAEKRTSDLAAWDRSFANALLQEQLYELINAANFLGIPQLLDVLSERLADMIRGKTVEEMRRVLNITSDFTPEEEEAMRREHGWAFE